MNDEAVRLLFESLSYVLENQKKIMRHLGITKCDSDFGYDDDKIGELICECDSLSSQYEHD